MAHWIIEDYGFRGCYYKCSKCGKSWSDLFDTLNGTCPNCNSVMDEDETEYIVV